jgi:hypothetical protein
MVAASKVPSSAASLNPEGYAFAQYWSVVIGTLANRI